MSRQRVEVSLAFIKITTIPSAVFPDAWTTYWKGSEEDLKQQDLVINVSSFLIVNHSSSLCPFSNQKCYDWNCIRRNQWMGSARINLFDLATGSVTRSQIHLYEKKGKRHVANATLDFVAYFQEVHMFELNCHDWQCFNLIPPTPDAEIHNLENKALPSGRKA